MTWTRKEIMAQYECIDTPRINRRTVAIAGLMVVWFRRSAGSLTDITDR